MNLFQKNTTQLGRNGANPFLACNISKSHELIMEEQAIKPHSITYYSDSKVVLGPVVSKAFNLNGV
jgi:hypothetical protein